MPKMKTNSGAKKRFALTGTGKIKRKHAYKSHILTKKSKKRKRNLTKSGLVNKADVNSIKTLLALKSPSFLSLPKRDLLTGCICSKGSHKGNAIVQNK